LDNNGWAKNIGQNKPLYHYFRNGQPLCRNKFVDIKNVIKLEHEYPYGTSNVCYTCYKTLNAKPTPVVKKPAYKYINMTYSQLCNKAKTAKANMRYYFKKLAKKLYPEQFLLEHFVKKPKPVKKPICCKLSYVGLLFKYLDNINSLEWSKTKRQFCYNLKQKAKNRYPRIFDEREWVPRGVSI